MRNLEFYSSLKHVMWYFCKEYGGGNYNKILLSSNFTTSGRSHTITCQLNICVCKNIGGKLVPGRPW